jgi:hypothetical protein
MQRRRFLKLIALGVAGGALAPDATAASVVTCRVAGVKYQDHDVSRLREGAPVVVRRQRYQGEVCYRVTDADGATLGYVPRSHLPQLAGRRVVGAWLAQVNPHAVPWKRLELALALK